MIDTGLKSINYYDLKEDDPPRQGDFVYRHVESFAKVETAGNLTFSVKVQLCFVARISEDNKFKVYFAPYDTARLGSMADYDGAIKIEEWTSLHGEKIVYTPAATRAMSKLWLMGYKPTV